jgi:hypothetical protein
MPGSDRGRLPVAAPDFIDENQHGVVIHVVHKCLQFVFGLPEALGHVFDQLYGIHFFKKLTELVGFQRLPREAKIPDLVVLVRVETCDS